MITYNRWFFLLFIFGLFLAAPLPVNASHLIQTDINAYCFSEKSGDLKEIVPLNGIRESAASDCLNEMMPPVVSFSLSEGHPLKEAFAHLTYALEEDTMDKNSRSVVFKSASLLPGVYFTKRFVIVDKSHFVDVTLTISGTDMASFLGAGHLQMTLNPPGAGEGHFLNQESTSDDRTIVFIVKKEALTLSEMIKKENSAVNEGSWAGFRDRFSARMIKPVTHPFTVEADMEGSSMKDSSNTSGLILGIKPASAIFSARVYDGPVDWFSFGEERETLSFLLYDALWFWIRWISFGLFFILYGLIQVIGSPGLSIILLSLAVKIMMLPLVRLSDRWQAEVNRNNALLEPHLKQIKASYKGHVQHQKILAMHKELGIHPMYSLKTFLGVFTQVPIFFAAYHTLSENVWLKGVSFLWIRDLSEPDHFLKLPFDLFYFGEYLNLFPVLMTVITIFTAAIFQDKILTKDQLKKQKMNLYAMAAAFFILFYPFPAGMVLYWTMNNLWSLIKELVRKGINPRHQPESA